MSTADKLNKLLETKEAIKQAIIDKGGTVGDVFADYPAAIQNIQGGGGSGTFVVPAGMKFAYSNDIKEFPEDWDWSEAEQADDLSYLFQNCTSLIKVPKLTITNATKTSNMFGYCSALTEIDVSNWDLSKVKDMSNMFSNCKALTSIKGEINSSSNTNFQYIFYSCNNLRTIPALDCTSNTSTSSSYNSPVGSCYSLRTFGGLIGMNKSFYCSGSDVLSYESLLNVLNGLADGVSGQTLTLNEVLVNLLTDDDIAIATSKGWSVSPSRTITSPVVVTDLKQVPASTVRINPNIYDFSQYNGNWGISGNYTLLPCKNNLKVFEGNISNTTDATYMFGSCGELRYVNLYYTGNVTNMVSMLKRTSALLECNLSEWDTSQVTDMAEMFYETGLEEIDLKGWNTSNVTDMSRMFYNCKARVIDLRGFVFSKVITMYRMFSNCDYLQEVYIDGDISNVNDVSEMFNNITIEGTLYYNPAYDYSKIIAELPATWTAVPLTE